jgi:uncharacterized protein YtpQ (UPF0354 family)
MMTDEQTLKKRLLESQNNLELQKSEHSLKVNNLENNLKKLNLELDALNAKLISEQNETEISRYSSLSKINESNSQVSLFGWKNLLLEKN